MLFAQTRSSRLNAARSLVAILLTAASLEANIEIPRVFTKNMILQQDTMVNLWGTADPGETVTVTGSWSETGASTTAGADGKWSVQLATPKARTDGTTYTLVFEGNNTVTLTNIAIGDVWIISGQSNVNITTSINLPGGSEAIGSADIPDIRLHRFRSAVASEPLDTPSLNSNFITWQVSAPNTATSFSAVGYFFLRNLYSHTGVPQGMIHVAQAGTAAQTWTPLEEIQQIEEYADQGPFPVDGSFNKYHQPTIHFNGTIAPLTPFTVKGIIWYQGETNVDLDNPGLFAETLPRLISGWRRVFQQEDLPFLLVEIVPYPDYPNDTYPEVLEVQNAALSIPGTAIVSTLDLASTSLHPPEKKPIGDRLATAARALVYGEDIVHAGPQYAGHLTEGSSLRVHFANVGGGLVLDGPDSQFEIAGANGVYYPATAGIEGNSLVLQSNQVADPLHVRYAWSTYPQARLFNTEGFATPTFRTDIPDYLPSVFAYVPGQETWAGLLVREDGFVDTGDFLGWLNVRHQPWIYQESWDSWIYIEEDSFSLRGSWIYVAR